MAASPLQKNGVGGLTASPFVSPPQAFESDVTPTATENGNAAVDLSLGQVAATLHVEYDVQVLQAPTDYVETTFVRVEGVAGYRCALYLVLGLGGWVMNTSSPDDDHGDGWSRLSC